ncbi:B12-binding domain-containing radical SAM protein [Candidatus Omnitrophota bacterium]
MVSERNAFGLKGRSDKNMKITFVRPPFYSLLNAADYKLNTYPLQLGYLAACAGRVGWDTGFVDGEDLDAGDILKEAAGMSKSEYIEFTMHDNITKIDKIMQSADHPVWGGLADEILTTGPDLIGITCYSSSMNSVKLLCENIKRRANVPIILGGIHPTSLPVHSLKYTKADMVVVGEGETTLTELLRICPDGGQSRLNKIEGLAYKTPDGGIIVNKARGNIDDLDSLPFPDRDFFDKGAYSGDVMSTSRGCPFSCNYCASKVMWQRKVRFRGVESVLAELTTLRDKYNSSFIRIVDDTFTLKRERVMDLCRGIQEKGLNSIRFSLGSRVDRLDEEMAGELKKSGVETVTLGIESASPRILKFIEKNETLKAMADSIRILKRFDIQSHAFFMIGFPGETKADIEMSKEFIASHRPDYCEVNMVTPYPGTPLWDMTMKDKEYSVDNWYQRFHQGLSAGFDLPYDLNEEYESFVRFTKEIGIRGEATTAIKEEEKAL